MRPKKIFENIMLKKYFIKISENMYLNDLSELIVVYAKTQEQFQKINPGHLVNTLLQMDQCKNDFWFISPSLDMFLISELIKAGFVILSRRDYINKYNKKWLWEDKYFGKRYIWSKEMMCAILYKKYPVLYLESIHEPRSAVRLVNKYELKINMNFDKIVDKCAEIHGEKWLSAKMRNLFKTLYREKNADFQFVSFEVYRNNGLKAGEFGCIIGKMYISYSGYYEESSAGTVQMVKMFRYLKSENVVCCNLFGYGESFKYKYKFGTTDVDFRDYIKLFNENKKNV